RQAFDPPLPDVLLAGLAVASHCGATRLCEDPLLASFCEVELVTSGPPPPPVLFRRGDADGNGEVNLTDAIFTLNRLFKGGPPPDCADAADVNDDGKLDLTDPVHLASHLFRGGPAPERPGPLECGADEGEGDELEECVYHGCG
ncbi:MAG: hypothetical protein HY721_14535, partial [Planctomycetes bacterium]|nr:hypothetical protein [Planctomycetota bacterium]